MLTLDMIIAMLAWPALATALVLATAWLPVVARSRAAVLVAPAAIAIGFLVGYVVVVGPPALAPALDAKARLPHVALVALAVATLGAFTERRAIRWTAILLGSVVTMRLVLGAAIEFQWTTMVAAVRVLALAAGMAAVTLLASDFVARVPARTGSLGLAAIGGGAAPVMLFSDSLLMAQLHGVLGVAVGVVALAVWIAPARVSLAAAAPVVIAIAWSHWVIGLLFANMPLASFLLLTSAAAAAALATRALQQWAPRRHALAAVLALSTFVVGSVAIGGERYVRTSAAPATTGSADQNDNYGYYQ